MTVYERFQMDVSYTVAGATPPHIVYVTGIAKATMTWNGAAFQQVNLTTGSVAGHVVYEGGAGYVTAKHGARVIAETLRLELNGRPIRITEVAPGMVATEEFSLVRLRGDQAAADKVYAGVTAPLTADDIADCIAFAATRPSHVNLDLMIVKPVAQAAPHKIARS